MWDFPDLDIVHTAGRGGREGGVGIDIAVQLSKFTGWCDWEALSGNLIRCYVVCWYTQAFLLARGELDSLVITETK